MVCLQLHNQVTKFAIFKSHVCSGPGWAQNPGQHNTLSQILLSQLLLNPCPLLIVIDFTTQRTIYKLIIDITFVIPINIIASSGSIYTVRIAGMCRKIVAI